MNEKSKTPGQTVSLPDGRQLGYLIIGEGRPVFYLHGAPASRLEALCAKQMATSGRLQIIAVERPGFGLSTYVPNRTLRDHASDVAFLADKLGIERFALIASSGGSPFGPACAALLSKRLTHVVVIGGFSLPVDFSGMAWWNMISVKLDLVPMVNMWVEKNGGDFFLKFARDPDTVAKSWTGKLIRRTLAPDDVKFLETPSEMRNAFLQSSIEAYRQGTDFYKASIELSRLLHRGWEVDLSQIPSGLVHLWHGSTDHLCPVGNAYKNAKAIPGAHLKIFKDEGHFSWLNHLEELGELLIS